MTTKVSVRLVFAAGHRILGLEGAGAKCRNPHGHTWTTTFTWRTSEKIWPPTIEFGEAKAALRERIRTVYDHAFICAPDDTKMIEFLERESAKCVIVDGPPTTERIAAQLAYDAAKLLPDATLISVRVEEGPENSAEWVPEQWWSR